MGYTVLLDPNRSFLSSVEIDKFKKEIVRQTCVSICQLQTTSDVVSSGIAAMRKDGYCMVGEWRDI